MSGKLYIVPTPIGNLGDITYRAVLVLKSVKKILAEDTRTTRVLLNHYEINTPCESFHIHNEHHKLAKYIQELKEGADLAQVSDAGTPAVSDPGYLLTREAIAQGIDIEVLPGATAFLPALIKSGFALHKFTFEGFLPQKKGRQTKLMEWSNYDDTLVFYESREITKKFEETINGTLTEAVTHFENRAPKGEFVVVLEGAKYANNQIEDLDSE